MRLKISVNFYFSFLLLLLLTLNSFAQQSVSEKHVYVAMRMVGDELLLNSGDSTSRVLPIEDDGNRYKIQFENDFELNPNELIPIIDSVFLRANLSVGYLVEVENCDSNKVVYSYEIKGTNLSPDSNLIPCRSRVQPKACYILFITLADNKKSIALKLTGIDEVNQTLAKADNNSLLKVFLTICILFLVVVLLLFYFKKKKKGKIDVDNYYIGKYQFDKKNMILLFENESVELSSKEADLLHLLYASENVTLEREHILNVVWGDTGDYIGRTLDVFISKLRKKLEADSNLKIINIRGVGYKFVENK